MDQPDPRATEVGTEARRPSVVLLLAGVVALLVSVAALTGLIPWVLENRPDAGVGRWVAVAVVVGVGVLLVAAPMRKKHHQH
nr:hypothetical protein [Rhodococcus sp. X156]